jgi:hypothetical protein
VSDSYAADMGIRFLFLIVEAKGLIVNETLISAQNQATISGASISGASISGASISGASMLRILKDLSDTCYCSGSCP